MRNPMPPPPVRPFGVDAASYNVIMAAAQPLARDRRDAVLEEVAEVVRKTGANGEGELHRICRELQRRHFDPPLDVGHQRVGKYGRAG
jgi:hypothetical protein